MDLNLGSTRALIDECRRQGLLRNQCAYVLATAMWETGGSMKPVKETTSKKNPNPTDAQVKRILTRAWNAGKLPWVKKDYWSDGYFGRGYVQLTHRPNYDKASDKLGVDFVAHPDKVMADKWAIPICVTGMREGWFTGKKLSDYITLAKSDFINARRIINGKDKAGEIAKLARDYDMDLQVNGYAQKPASARPAPVATIPAIEAKPAPAPVPVDEKEQIKRVQDSLTKLGYTPGGVDGLMGPLTRGSILSFRNDNGLPAGDGIDDDLIGKLQTAQPRKMVPERANADSVKIATVVPEVNKHWWNKYLAIGGGATTAIGGAVEHLAPATGYLQPVKDFLGDIPTSVWVVAIVLVAGLVWWNSRQGQIAGDDAYRTGARR